MRKKLGSVLLTGLLVLSSLTACGRQDTPSVYYLNFKPEQDAQWQEIAKRYEERTGIPVTVVTAASGMYETTLQAEIEKSDAPTLFQVNGPIGLESWKDYCYDLNGTQVYQELLSDAYTLKSDNEVLALAYTSESYGLIVNRTLLTQAGYEVSNIASFADLKVIAEDITARSGELGFAAFTSAGMEGSSDWRFKTHLANLPIYYEYQDDGVDIKYEIAGTYLDGYRNLFDLYISNSTCPGNVLSAKTGDDARNEFLQGKAVFFQNGSWEYANLVGEGRFTDEELAMIPIYIGVGNEAKQGLCNGTENYWCVNREASPEDIAATLDFMYWCVSSQEGTKAMAEQLGFVIPFRNAEPSDNLFVQQDAAYRAEGKVPVAWSFLTIPSDAWKNKLGSALTAYAAAPTDANWEVVRTVFVEEWKSEYAQLRKQ